MPSSWSLAVLVALAASSCSASPVVNEPSANTLAKRWPNPRPAGQDGGYHWVDTWTSMPQLTEAANLPNAPFNSTGRVFCNTTIRQTLHLSLGTSKGPKGRNDRDNLLRVSFSNAFGGSDLEITSATIALPGTINPVTNTSYPSGTGASDIQPQTLQPLTFSSGNAGFRVPNGALVVSDPIAFPVGAQEEITVTMYLAQGQATNNITSHPGSRTSSYLSLGDQTTATNMSDPSTQTLAHWYYVSAVEKWAPAEESAFVIVGDSITDGRGSLTNMNDRWPDLVLRKMQQDSFAKNVGVNNQAAGGNRVLADGLGPNALGRIDRDVLAQSGLKYAMVFEGVNDIGTANATQVAQQDIGDRLIEAYQQMVTRVHARGVPVFAATITPFGAPNSTIQPYSDPLREQTRLRVNDWIKTSGWFDAVIDFASIVGDPNNATQLNPLYNSGDFLHPNVAGYQAIADAFPIDLFQTFAGGVSDF